MESETESVELEECATADDEAPSWDEVDETIGDSYCFESDHVALKTNADYHRLLKTICLLEAQRSQAIADMEQLYRAKEQVLQDPIRFVDRLQRTGDLGIPVPGRQKIVDLPDIDWQRYTKNVDFKSFGAFRQSARLKNMANDNEDENLQQLKYKLERGADSGEGSLAEGFVRGRFKDDSKSATFNKLWTPAEQRKLDELLVKFPPEEVEARRWRKIATAFGDRTPQQIASRVQKYFLKLGKNKLPVPGRVPNRLATKFKRGGHRLQRQSWQLRESTFLQQYTAPVTMREDGEEEGAGEEVLTSSSFMSFSSSSFMEPGPSYHSPPLETAGGEERVMAGQELSEDEDMPEELRHTAEYRELKQLKKLREEKLTTLDPSLPKHHSYKCDRCGCAPIVGVRWHCVDCPSNTSIDFCETCFQSEDSVESGCHNSSHRIRPVKRTWTKQNTDQDYLRFNSKDAPSTHYNYLDPNYMPAV